MATKGNPIRFAVAPGYFIREELEARRWSQQTLAEKMGRPYQALNAIINGHKIITAETAIELGKAFGISAVYWLNLQTAYQLYKAAQKESNAPAKSKTVARRAISEGKTARQSAPQEFGPSALYLVVKDRTKVTRKSSSGGVVFSKKKTPG
jgi:addiction module HigA family antidote